MPNLNELPELPKTNSLQIDLIDLEDLGIDDNFLEKDAFNSSNKQKKDLDSLIDEDSSSKITNSKNKTVEVNNDDLLIDDNDMGFDDFGDFDDFEDFSVDELEDIDISESDIQEKSESLGAPSTSDLKQSANNNNYELDTMDLEIENLFEDGIANESNEDSKIETQKKDSQSNESKVLDITETKNKENQEFLNSNNVSWFQGLQNRYISSISHAFLLDFNTKDYVLGRENLESFITEYAAIGTFDITIKYDLAGGLQFIGPDPEQSKNNFLDATGLNDKKKDLEQNEIYMALNDDPAGADMEPVIPESPLDVFSLIAPLFTEKSQDGNNGKILLYLNAIDMLLPDAPIAQMSITDRKLLMLLENIASSAEADAHNNLLIMAANNGQDVHSSLKRASTRIEKINLPLPNKAERMEFIEEELIRHQNLNSIFAGTLTAAGLSNLSAGLSKMQIEDIAFRAVSDESAHGIISETLVRERKTDIIKAEYEDVIEIIDSDITFADIGGMEKIKEYFLEEVINPIKSGSDDLWMVPLGVMFLGPAGTGKTLLAQAVAKESQMNCVNLNIAKILNKYVGASEKNFEKALQCISSMEPTIVIVEEIDNVFNGRGNDSSGVGGRLFKRFLEFMSDTTRRGKVIVIATSNYPSRMDAALKRPGRFDKKIPFLVPESSDRLNILNVLCTRKGFPFEIKNIKDEMAEIKKDPQKTKELGQIIATTEGMTGAELETIVQKAITYAFKEKRALVSVNDIYRATSVVIPSTSAIQEMTAEALIECNDLDFIPEKYRKYAKELKEKLVEKKSFTEPGSVNG